MFFLPPTCQSQRSSYDPKTNTHIIPQDLADIWGARVGSRDDFDQFGFRDLLRRDGREEGLQVDIPMGTEPYESLDRDDGPAPNKGPFLGSNVLLVQILGEIEAKEDGPDDGKRPYVRVQPEGDYCARQNREQTGPKRKASCQLGEGRAYGGCGGSQMRSSGYPRGAP